MKKNLKNILLLLGVGLMIPMLAAHASEKVNFDIIESVMIRKTNPESAICWASSQA